MQTTAFITIFCDIFDLLLDSLKLLQHPEDDMVDVNVK